MRSGQVIMVSVGVQVTFTNAPTGRRYLLKAHPSNAGPVWVGNDGTGNVTSSDGFPLNPGEGIEVDCRRQLNGEIYAVAENANDKVCFFVIID